MILDGAKGLVKGHEVALPATKRRHDHFHILKDLKDCARFLNNQEASRVTATLKLYTRAENARDETKKRNSLQNWQKHSCNSVFSKRRDRLFPYLCNGFNMMFFSWRGIHQLIAPNCMTLLLMK